MFVNTGGYFIADVRRFSEGMITKLSKLRILESVPVFSVNPNHLIRSSIAVSCMICRFTPNHGNVKPQTIQILAVCFAYYVWHQCFIAVTRFNTKVWSARIMKLVTRQLLVKLVGSLQIQQNIFRLHLQYFLFEDFLLTYKMKIIFSHTYACVNSSVLFYFKK